MKLIYEDVDITEEVEILNRVAIDNAGDIADSVDVLFSDKNGFWRNWSPQRGDSISIEDRTFSTGTMFVDECFISPGKFLLKAISMPLEAKTPHSKAWEKISFRSLAEDLTKELGLELETYGVSDYFYERVDQVSVNNIQFLSERCSLEGYRLKLSGNKAIVYDEKYMESRPSVVKIDGTEIGVPYDFGMVSSDLFSSCEISYFDRSNAIIKHIFSPPSAPIGPVLKPTRLPVTSINEAERFAKNLLRRANKYEYAVSFPMELNTQLSGGNVLEIYNMGMFSGRYFIERIRHDINRNKSYIQARKTLEGY